MLQSTRLKFLPEFIEGTYTRKFIVIFRFKWHIYSNQIYDSLSLRLTSCISEMNSMFSHSEFLWQSWLRDLLRFCSEIQCTDGKDWSSRAIGSSSGSGGSLPISAIWVVCGETITLEDKGDVKSSDVHPALIKSYKIFITKHYPTSLRRITLPSPMCFL